MQGGQAHAIAQCCQIWNRCQYSRLLKCANKCAVSQRYSCMTYPVQKPLLQSSLPQCTSVLVPPGADPAQNLQYLSLPASSFQSSFRCQAAAPSRSKHSRHTGRLANSGCLRLPGSFLRKALRDLPVPSHVRVTCGTGMFASSLPELFQQSIQPHHRPAAVTASKILSVAANARLHYSSSNEDCIKAVHVRLH